MEAVAKTKYLKGSPRKARLVIDLIRGVKVARALSLLKFTDKRAADPIAQCLNSAIANATFKAEQQNIAIDPDDLWVKTCFVDMGPHKHRSRMRPAPQGRAYREQRHYCHITIHVTSEVKPLTEEQERLEALRAERIAARKVAKAAEKAKAPAKKKETKAAPVEEVVETPVVETVQTEAAAEAVAAEETPVETVETEAAATETVEEAAVEAAENVDTPAEMEAAGDAEVADAKNVETQTTASLNETKPADEAQQKINEDLERQ
ncbi:MAG: 50S ribosomal protein L22 [Pyrinomonadaceae bacterium]|nr:50S ribosomal protein L22 [Acidobacteriota bacterium]MBP9108354.1 50S ribosomal protein L22 [Pyrinomonadaceae bacterium]